MTNDTEALRGSIAHLTSEHHAEMIMGLLAGGPRWADKQPAPRHLDSKQLRFALAEHRQAYASWTVRNGLKQDHAVFLRHPYRLSGLTLTADQFIFVDGWEKHPRATALHAAYLTATGQEA